MNISGSVGQGGANFQQDVRTVQTLLNKHASRIPGMTPLVVDGLIGPKTINAIKMFQKSAVGFPMPDGRVDVGGRTWQALNAAAGSPGASPGGTPGVSPTPAPGSGPVGDQQITLTVRHGGQIPTNTNGLASTSGTMYESTFVLSGAVSGQFTGSIYPDDMNVKGRVVDGSYPLHIGFHKGGSAARQTTLAVETQGIRCGLLVNARNGVPVESNNASKTTSYGINVHNGFNSQRYSDGCLTLQPADWSNFISLFINAFPNIDDWHTVGTNTGKRVGTLVIQS